MMRDSLARQRIRKLLLKEVQIGSHTHEASEYGLVDRANKYPSSPRNTTMGQFEPA